MVTVTITEQTDREGGQCCNPKCEFGSVVVCASPLTAAFEAPIEDCCYNSYLHTQGTL